MQYFKNILKFDNTHSNILNILKHAVKLFKMAYENSKQLGFMIICCGSASIYSQRRRKQQRSCSVKLSVQSRDRRGPNYGILNELRFTDPEEYCLAYHIVLNRFFLKELYKTFWIIHLLLFFFLSTFYLNSKELFRK